MEVQEQRTQEVNAPGSSLMTADRFDAMTEEERSAMPQLPLVCFFLSVLLCCACARVNVLL